MSLIAAVIALAVSGVGALFLAPRDAPPPTAVAPSATARPSAASVAATSLAPRGLYISSGRESDDCVRRAFPDGVATEDARAEIGTAPSLPDSTAPDGTSAFVAELELPVPVTAERARAAFPPSGEERPHRRVLGRVAGSEQWRHVAGAKEDTRFQRLAVVVDLVDPPFVVDANRLERETRWARSLAETLTSSSPTFSMSPAHAVAKAQAAMAARRQYSDADVEIGVMVVAPPHARFAGRKVWDAVYSAGFTWGDGDYFHWSPSKKTDDSQGISMGTTTGSTYFLPESIVANDGSADVVDLEMSFNAARCWQPTQMFDVMVRSAAYLARRLGGTVRATDGTAFDARAVRARVASVEQGLSGRGVVPGTELSLELF